jgi:putative ABC transport system permease protein
MRYKDLGFSSQHAISATLNLNAARYRDKNRHLNFLDRLLEHAAAIPGVESVALASASEIPPGEGHATNTVRIEGRPLAIDSRQKALTRQQVVSASYFHILQIPLFDGRFLRDSDGARSVPVVVVNRQFAQRYFPQQTALGRRLLTGETEGVWSTIVGVVGDSKTSGLTTAAEPSVYTPYRQSDGQRLHELGVLIESALPMSSVAPAFRRIVNALDPEQPIASIETLDERLNASVSRPRFTAGFLFAFSCAGILLAIIGVYGVVACRARSHLREIAVRQALGARPGDVIAHIMWHSVRLICPGVLSGFLAALAGNRLISNLLFQVKPGDPHILAVVCLLIVTVALCSSLVPAVRAARADPLVSLRQN